MNLRLKGITRPYRFGLVAILLILSVSLLAACGDTPTVTPVASKPATPTAMSNEDLAKLSGGATTAASAVGATSAAGATTVAGAITSAAAVTNVAGATTAGGAAGTPGAATTAQAATTPAATPTGTGQNEPPNLAYPGGREVKIADATLKQLIDSSGNPDDDQIIGRFEPSKFLVYFSPDAPDKIEDFYKKALEGAGWQLFSRNADPSVTLMVYQKGGTKLIAQFVTLPSAQGLPPEFASVYKQGDRLILLGTGSAYVPTPTPFAIPGSATLPISAGQKKIATIEMESGAKIVMELYPDIAPKTVENFEKLAAKGFYNGLTFHRVEPGFVVQGGDPKGDGTGGPGYTIPDEFTTQKKHEIGTVAMAHSAAPNSAGSQFYITIGPASHLDGKYAIFGKVTEGMDAVSKIKIGDKMKTVKVEVK